MVHVWVGQASTGLLHFFLCRAEDGGPSCVTFFYNNEVKYKISNHIPLVVIFNKDGMWFDFYILLHC